MKDDYTRLRNGRLEVFDRYVSLDENIARQTAQKIAEYLAISEHAAS